MRRLAAVVIVGDCPPLSAGPRLDIGAVPDLPHRKLYDMLRPVFPLDELLHTLAAHAEHRADLGRADKVMHGKNHSHDATGHLTRGQGSRNTSHMTSASKLGVFDAAALDYLLGFPSPFQSPEDLDAAVRQVNEQALDSIETAA